MLIKCILMFTYSILLRTVNNRELLDSAVLYEKRREVAVGRKGNIMLSEISQSEKYKYRMISRVCGI